MALGAFPRNRCEVNDELTFRVTIAGNERFYRNENGTNQMSLAGGNGRAIAVSSGLSTNHCMFTLRILTASDEHASALTQHRYGATLQDIVAPQNFNDMPVRLTFQRTNVSHFRIARTAEKRTVTERELPKFGPRCGQGLGHTHRNGADLAIFTHAALTPINTAYFIYLKR